MPKRTNTFQRLVKIARAGLGPEWELKESCLLGDLDTGTLREVDIVAHQKAGEHDIYISIECRDHRRRADVQWVEAMAKKHERLPTSKLILWSSSGFSKEAQEKAKKLKIDTVSQANAANVPWAKIGKELIGGSVQLSTVKFSPFIDGQLPNGTKCRLQSVDDAVIYDKGGQVVQTIKGILSFMKNSPQFRTTVLDYAGTGGKGIYCEVRPPVPWFTDAPEGIRLSILRIGIGGAIATEDASLDTKAVLTQGKLVTLSTAKTSTGRFELLLEEHKDASQCKMPE